MTIFMNHGTITKHLPPFIGRETELKTIFELIDDPDCRLLSLVGPGGIGKTRLAIEILKHNEDKFSDGAYFVPLQPLSSSENIISAIASSLNFEFYDEEEQLKEQLIHYLQDKTLLIVLDNFEHLISGAEILTDILAYTLQVKIIVTSREALRLQQEYVRFISGMSYPDNAQISENELYDAVTLFADRASQFRSNFDLEKEWLSVVRICQLVGGMPLGIELAVSWLKTLTCEEIATEIERNIDLLTAQTRDVDIRHQSIRQIFEATWEMLTAEEKLVFMRLSAFQGMPTRHAIQAITCCSLMTLMGLTDKALLVPDEQGRYLMHELLREFAFEKLQADDEYTDILNAHSQYYLQLMADRQADLYGRRQLEAMREISYDFENVRRAWHWAVEHDDYEGIAKAIEALCIYLHFRSIWQQENYLLKLAMEKFADGETDRQKRVWGMLIARTKLTTDSPIDNLKTALEIAHQHNDIAEIGIYYLLLGYAYSYDDKIDEAYQSFEQSLPYLEKADDKYHQVAIYGAFATIERSKGNYDQCMIYNEKALTLSREIGDIGGQAEATAELSNILLTLGKLEESEVYRREAILLAEQFGRLWSIAWQKLEWATYHVFGLHGDLDSAQQIVQETESLIYITNHKKSSLTTALVKSLFASVQGNYDEALQVSDEAKEYVSPNAWGSIASWGTLIAYCGQGKYDEASDLLHDLLVYFHELKIISPALTYMLFGAIVLAYRDKNLSCATEILALSMTHKSSMSGWMRLWAVVDALQTNLEAELGTPHYQRLWEQGKQADWELVTADLIQKLSQEDVTDNNEMGQFPEQVIVANESLIEPLSLRELEVLHKIAEGLTNRQIADELFIGTSTVKKHITHIYGKLEVDNRTQALLRAQELHLT